MISMLQKIQNFYLLEEMYALAKEKCSMYDPRQGRFISDLSTYRAEHNENLSLMLRDYLTLACIVEGRYGERKCYAPFVLRLAGERRLFKTIEMNSRNACCEKVLSLTSQIDPHLTLAFLLPYFTASKWEAGYGGKAWGVITTTTLLHYDTPREVFVDTVINLQHNTSTCLDKLNPFFHADVPGIKDFLNRRALTDFSFFLRKQNLHPLPSIHIPYSLGGLLDRGVEMGLFEPNEDKWLDMDRVREGESYTPLTWGEGVITCEEVKRK